MREGWRRCSTTWPGTDDGVGDFYVIDLVANSVVLDFVRLPVREEMRYSNDVQEFLPRAWIAGDAVELVEHCQLKIEKCSTSIQLFLPVELTVDAQ